MNVAEIVAECREWFTDPEFGRLKALREESPPRRLMGCFPVYTPEEVALACGFVPVHVYGAGGMVEIDHADSRMQSFVCSVTRSTLELGLTKRLDLLDGMLFPSICDVSRNLSGIWHRNLPSHLSEYVHFPENLESAHAVGYLVHELKRLEERFTAISGVRPDAAAYRAAFDLVNRHRAAMADLYRLRAQAPWKVPMADGYAVLRAGGMMPRERHLPLLALATRAWRESEMRPRDRVRVVLEGSFCEQPPLELLSVMEESGCDIVDDDLLLGQRWFPDPLPLDGDPLTVLAEAVLRRSVASAVHHPGHAARGPALVRKVRESGAEGVVFCMAKFCEPALYDYVRLKRALEAEHIPYLAFEFEEKMGIFETVRAQIETFVESILLFS